MKESSEETWVVYTSVGGMGYRAVCSQSKWERMTAGRPYYFVLIQGNIPSQEEAERIARTSDQRPSVPLAGSAETWLRPLLTPQRAPEAEQGKTGGWAPLAPTPG
jgi:hypothetical protein